MSTKKDATADKEAEELLSGAPQDDDLLAGAGDTAKPKAKKAAVAAKTAKPAAKTAKGAAAKPAAEAKPAKAPAEPKAKANGAAKPAAKPEAKAKTNGAAKPAKPAKAPGAPKAKGVRGQGKFYPDPAVMDPLRKQIAGVKKEISTRELAERFSVETWQARLAAAALAKEGKGSMSKVGSVLVYTPAAK